jgi:hypothetical protein
MNKLITVSLASTLMIASMSQVATAGERTKHHQAATTNEQVRNANASAVPFYVPAEDEFARLRNGAGSAPAGR